MGRDVTQPMLTRRLELYRWVQTAYHCSSDCRLSGPLQRFDLPALGCHRRVDRRATRIQIGDYLLLCSPVRQRNLNFAKIPLSKTLTGGSGETCEYLVLPPRCGKTVCQETVVKAARRANDADMLVYVSFTEAIWNERTTPDRGSRDI